MNKFIPKEKQSKKLQRALSQAKRGSWGAISPVTRRPENSKAYNRKKVQKGDNFLLEPFLFAL